MINWFSTDFQNYITEELFNKYYDQNIDEYFKKFTAYGMTDIDQSEFDTLQTFLGGEKQYQEMRRKWFELVKYLVSTPGALICSEQIAPDTCRLYRAEAITSFNPATYAPFKKSKIVPCPHNESSYLEPVFYGLVSYENDDALEQYYNYADINHGDFTPYGVVSCRELQSMNSYEDQERGAVYVPNFLLNLTTGLDINSDDLFINGDLTQKIEDTFLVYLAKTYCDLGEFDPDKITLDYIKEHANEIDIKRPLKGYECDQTYAPSVRMLLGYLLLAYNKAEQHDGSSEQSPYNKDTMNSKVKRERSSFYFFDRLYIQCLFEVMNFSIILLKVISNKYQEGDKTYKNPWYSDALAEYGLLYSMIDPESLAKGMTGCFIGTFQSKVKGFHSEMAISMPALYENVDDTFIKKSRKCKNKYMVNSNFHVASDTNLIMLQEPDIELLIRQTQPKEMDAGTVIFDIYDLEPRHESYEMYTEFLNFLDKYNSENTETRYLKALNDFNAKYGLPKFEYSKTYDEIMDYFKDIEQRDSVSQSSGGAPSKSSINDYKIKFPDIKRHTQRENYQLVNKLFFDPKYADIGGKQIKGFKKLKESIVTSPKELQLKRETSLSTINTEEIKSGGGFTKRHTRKVKKHTRKSKKSKKSKKKLSKPTRKLKKSRRASRKVNAINK